ncbi:MAG: hypothetical protein J2P17_19800, partial [Mycobacterium sp.]|nr:hypothetical protein [Mycobacterium sp.]
MDSQPDVNDELAEQHSFSTPSASANSVSIVGVRFRHPLRRLDVPVMILAVMISLDTVGPVSTFG